MDAGTTEMWEFVDELYFSVEGAAEPDLAQLGLRFAGVRRLVVEDWALYPWALQGLAWDKCRTARAIGALELIARAFGLELVLQPAKIKEGAVAAGAENLFSTPLHENRHQNDAIMHGTFFIATHPQVVGGAD